MYTVKISCTNTNTAQEKDNELKLKQLVREYLAAGEVSEGEIYWDGHNFTPIPTGYENEIHNWFNVHYASSLGPHAEKGAYTYNSGLNTTMNTYSGTQSLIEHSIPYAPPILCLAKGQNHVHNLRRVIRIFC